MAERPPEVPSCMPESPPPEFTVICIDNGRRAVYCKPVYRAQLKAAREYCKTVLECDPNNIVSIITMSSLGFGELVQPTSDLKQIMSALRYVPCQGEGETEFQRALACAYSTFSSAPSDMKKRSLMFVGSTIQLHLSPALLYGEKLKESGVVMNIFNFFRFKIDASFNKNASVLQGHYHYGRTELDTLVTTLNDEGNSRIVDIVDEYESSVLDILHESILKDHFDYLVKKAATDNEKNKSAADEKNKRVEERVLEQFNEKNKSVEPRELERLNEKKKSVVDGEYGQRFSGKEKTNQKKKTKPKQKKKKKR